MKKFYFILCTCLILTVSINAQTVWTGPSMTFTKAAFADANLEVNQDRITSNVWITRNNTRGIYNKKTESSYVDNVSPADTEWAFGTTSNLSSLTFSDWKTTINSNPASMVNADMVVHLITDNIYIDIKFTQWGQGNNGGGSFSYMRSTNNMGVEDVNQSSLISLYPNPAENYIIVSEAQAFSTYEILNTDGKLMLNGTLTSDGKIDIQSLPSGVYFINMDGKKESLKFIRK